MTLLGVAKQEAPLRTDPHPGVITIIVLTDKLGSFRGWNMESEARAGTLSDKLTEYRFVGGEKSRGSRVQPELTLPVFSCPNAWIRLSVSLLEKR